MRRHKHPIFFFFILISMIFAHSTLAASSILAPKIQPQRTVKMGMASWYSEQDPGINKYTANMEIFDDSGLTAAMWDVPFNQMVKVTNLDNGKSVTVRVNDRGPHRKLVRQGRLIDLSKGAFAKIANLRKGLINIQLELL